MRWARQASEHAFLKALKTSSELGAGSFFFFEGARGTFFAINTPSPLSNEGLGEGTKDRDEVEEVELEGGTNVGN